MPRRFYSSIAVRTTLSSAIDSSVTSITVVAVTGFPTSYPYTLVIDEGISTQEIVTVTAGTGTTLTVTRGVDDSTAVAHSTGAAVNHGVSARDFNEPNQFLNEGGTVTGASAITANTTTPALRVTQTGSGPALLVEDSANPDATPFVVDANGNVGVGTSSPSGPLSVYKPTGFSMSVEGDAGTNLLVIRSSDDTSGSNIILRKRRGTTQSGSAVASGDELGRIILGAYGGTSNRNLCAIVGQVETYTSDTSMSSALRFQTTSNGIDSTERMRITSAGNVGIGTTTPSFLLHAQSATNATAAVMGDSTTQLILRRSSDASVAPTIFFDKSRGTNAAPTTANSGDAISSINFRSHDGTGYITAATISANIDGTPGTNDMPGRLVFSTTADGASTPTERMRIDNAGLITGTGTSLGAWTSYTPVWTAATTNPSLGNGLLYGDYCQIGKLVLVRIELSIGSTTTFGSGPWRISLPVTARHGAAGLLGLLQGFDSSLGQTWQITARTSSTTLAGFTTNNLPVGFVSATAPFTWASGDNLAGVFYYEAA